MKCDVCGSKIELTFLNKLVGTVARDSSRKKRNVCAQCQRNGRIKEITTK